MMSNSNTSMSNNRGVDSVSEDRGVDSVGEDGGGVNHRASDHRGVVSRGSVNNRVSDHSLGILGLAVIGHIGDIAIVAVGVVVDMLDPAIGKSDRVGSLSVASTVRGLRGLEVGLGVVISHSIGVGVGGDHIRLSMVGGGSDHWGVVSWGSVDHGGVVHRGSVDSVSEDWGDHTVTNDARGAGTSDKGGDTGNDLRSCV